MKRLLFLLAALACSLTANAADKPNIIYILLDDAGWGDLSCYGQKKFSTPNIDRLASEGMKFTNHYSGSTVCAPTRCVLMTGVHTGHSFVRGNREVQPEGQAPMPADIVTIPRLLKKAGYTTGAFGKWGLGAPGSPSDPVEHFDVFYGYNCQRQAHTYYPTHLWSNRKKVEFDGKTHSQEPTMEAGFEFIRENKENPFFVFFAITIPHAAMHAPESYVAPFRKQFPQFEDTIGKYSGPEVKNPVAAFAGMMTQLDDGIGQLLDLLDVLEIDENTLVMLTSDNGPHKEGGHQPDFFDSNGPLKGYKRDLYEGGVRAPLLARWPGTIKPGTETGLISAHWDMLPTFTALAGAETPKGIDGISMVSTLTGEGKQEPHDYLYWEFYERGGKRAVRFGPWKAVQLEVNKLGFDAPIEIYNLTDDIGEENNVAGDHPELVEKARKMMDEAHEPSPLWTFKKPAPKKKGGKKK